jgi:hypothetical protein
MRYAGDEPQPTSPGRAMPRAIKQHKEARMAKLEELAVAVERWLADPRYVTEQLMIKALRELHKPERGS